MTNHKDGRSVGRPRHPDDLERQVSAMVTRKQRNLVMRLGHGNLAEGVRQALNYVLEHQGK